MKRAFALWLLGAVACSGGGIVGGECRRGFCGSSLDASTDAGEQSDATADAPDDGFFKHDGREGGGGSADAGDGGTFEAGDSACSADLQTDPDNCGVCFNQCPSGICQAGVCVGATTGHIVLACMSFEANTQASPQTTLLGNAVFLPIGDPVRILGYSEHAPNAIVNKVNQALGWAATAKGRSQVLTQAASAAAIPTTLSNSSYDVLLIYDQAAAPAGVLGPIGASWASAIATFVQAGGVVFVQSGGAGTGEMGALLTSAGLLPVSDQPTITGSVLYNQAPLDAVGLNVLSPFMAQKRTCTFTTSAVPGPTTVFVVSDGAPDAGPGDPVVVHRIP